MAIDLRRRFPDSGLATTRRDRRRRALDALQLALAMLLHWREVRRQRRALLSLSDRLLKDIGISRADAMQEAARPFWDTDHGSWHGWR